MMGPDKIIAASLQLEPDRAKLTRDIYRASALGISYILVNENMIGLAMTEIKKSDLEVKVSGIVGYPIGQWVWPSKAIALDELSSIQNGPDTLMHGVGPWLDNSTDAQEEWDGIRSRGVPWILTSLSAIPKDSVAALAKTIADAGVQMVITSNGVPASGLSDPDAEQIRALKDAADGRFIVSAMAQSGTSRDKIESWLSAGADRIVCADFWELCQSETTA